METLGALPDILTFAGEPVPVSRNPLTPGTRPLQLLPSPGTKFPVRYETSRMHSFQSEEICACVNSSTQVGVAWHGCSSVNSFMTQLFLCEQLRDATVRGARKP
ncbi:hypothetical protein JCGZ_03779 [Jatropha curcas]|uniref:Uncharacterized protein n=1 Tax=Jatropha curcas TaxID=180498 RepID=A0A067JCL6_JATCU|nr:hypothetical protein JCGZ_03779 [Jatropha curcas]